MTREEAIAEFLTDPLERPETEWHTEKDDPYLCGVCHQVALYDDGGVGIDAFLAAGVAGFVCQSCFNLMQPLPANWEFSNAIEPRRNHGPAARARRAS